MLSATSACSWKGRGDFPGWLEERNDELPLNLAGNFLLLVAVPQNCQYCESCGKREPVNLRGPKELLLLSIARDANTFPTPRRCSNSYPK